MCFRPAALDADVKPVQCSCGEMVFPTDGILPDYCPYCEEPLEVPTISATTPPGAPGIPGAPSAPGVPTPPGAPRVPAAPPAMR